MFEVGKQYRGQSTGKVIEVLCVGQTSTFVRIIEAGRQNMYMKGAEYLHSNAEFDNYTYVEPEVIKSITVDIWRTSDGELTVYPRGPFNPPIPEGYQTSGTIEVTESNKTGLTVKVLP